jgi:dTDP-4-dehydrorhamnose 3,5-epimerase
LSVLIRPTALPEVLLVEPKVFPDDRGFFMESYNRAAFSEAAGRDVEFVQDNHSLSRRGVLRGLHYQLPPHGQGKLVRAVVGEIFDVAVDIRRGSETFGRWVGERLSAANRRQLWIPEGFAHGFLTLSEQAEVLYKASTYYAPAYERSLAWNDPMVAIEWPKTLIPLLSPKDAAAPTLADAELFGGRDGR